MDVMKTIFGSDAALMVVQEIPEHFNYKLPY